MKLLRVLLAFFIIFSVAFTAIYGKNKIGVNGLDLSPKEYKGVISLWHIDGFEGGVFSRKQFLLKVARLYEKNNDGVLIMVTNHTIYSAERAMEEGVFPDVISYSLGLNIKGLTTLTGKSVFNAGMVGNKSYAVPWCKGNYVLIENTALMQNSSDKNIKNLLVSQAEFTQPLLAFALENLSAESVEIYPPMEAYVKFVSGKYPYFLATQRDVHRLISRDFSFSFTPLKNYNDLYQYISVTATDQNKRFYANDFINFLLKEENQNKIYEIGLFSQFCTIKYDNLKLSELAKTKNDKTLSIYIEPQKLKEIQELSLYSVKGDITAINKIKNLLINVEK